MSAAPRKIASGPPSDGADYDFAIRIRLSPAHPLPRRRPRPLRAAIRAYVCGKMMKWGPQFDLYGPIRAHDSRLRIAAVDREGQEGREKKRKRRKRENSPASRVTSLPFPASAAGASFDTSRSLESLRA